MDKSIKLLDTNGLCCKISHKAINKLYIMAKHMNIFGNAKVNSDRICCRV